MAYSKKISSKSIKILAFIFIIILVVLLLNKYGYFFNKKDNKMAIANFHFYFKKTVEQYRQGNADSAFYYASKMNDEALELKNDSFQVEALKYTGNSFYANGEYDVAICYYNKALLQAAEKKLAPQIPHLYNNIGWNYFKKKEVDTSIIWFKNGLTNTTSNVNPDVYLYANLCEASIEKNDLGSASDYLLNARRENNTQQDKYIGIAIEIANWKLRCKTEPINTPSLFISDLHLIIDSCKKNSDKLHHVNALIELASFFKSIEDKKNNFNAADSNLLYLKNALNIASHPNSNYKDIIINISEKLHKYYEKTKNLDSAYKYLNLKDSINNIRTKISQKNKVRAINIQDTIENSLKKNEESKQQKSIAYITLSIIVITIGIAFFVTFYTAIVSSRIIAFFGTFCLLMFFEFINLISHPVAEKITGENPLFMFCILLVIACLLVPIHHKIESKLLKHIPEYKQKRVQNARQTIDEESNGNDKHDINDGYE